MGSKASQVGRLPPADGTWIITCDCGMSRRVNRSRCSSVMRADSLAFSPDGGTLASVSNDNIIRLWDVVTGEQKRVLMGPMIAQAYGSARMARRLPVGVGTVCTCGMSRRVNIGTRSPDLWAGLKACGSARMARRLPVGVGTRCTCGISKRVNRSRC